MKDFGFTVLERVRFFPSWLAVMLCTAVFWFGIGVGFTWDFRTDLKESKEVLFEVQRLQEKQIDLYEELRKMQVNIDYFLSESKRDRVRK